MARSEVDERLVTTEIKRLIPVIGKETAERLNKAYLIGDENTRKRIFELVDVMRAAVMADNDMKDSVLMEPPPESIATQAAFPRWLSSSFPCCSSLIRHFRL